MYTCAAFHGRLAKADATAAEPSVPPSTPTPKDPPPSARALPVTAGACAATMKGAGANASKPLPAAPGGALPTPPVRPFPTSPEGALPYPSADVLEAGPAGSLSRAAAGPWPAASAGEYDTSPVLLLLVESVLVAYSPVARVPTALLASPELEPVTAGLCTVELLPGDVPDPYELLATRVLMAAGVNEGDADVEGWKAGAVATALAGAAAPELLLLLLPGLRMDAKPPALPLGGAQLGAIPGKLAALELVSTAGSAVDPGTEPLLFLAVVRLGTDSTAAMLPLVKGVADGGVFSAVVSESGPVMRGAKPGVLVLLLTAVRLGM